MKMVNETKKIMGDANIKLTATTVRIPVIGGHSESVNVEFEKEFDIKDIFETASYIKNDKSPFLPLIIIWTLFS